MSPPVLPEIDHAAVTPVRFADPSTQPVLSLRNTNEVHVIGHKAVRPNIHITPSTPLGHKVKVGPIVLVSEKGCQSSIPPLSHMVGNPSCYNASDASHVQKLI